MLILFTLYGKICHPGDTGLRGPVGEPGIPGTKGTKGDEGTNDTMINSYVYISCIAANGNE